MIAGGMSGVGVFMITGAGLVATPSPGSIFAYAAVTPKGGWFGVFLGILVAAGVTFACASALLGFGRLEKESAQEALAEQEAADAPTGLPVRSEA
jgi:PTS system mannitol-specific IIC component